MPLKEYVRKRNFQKTPEPKGNGPVSKEGHRFVIQKHAASRLHYDFRLELDGTLKSWAVPKGVPFKKGERRLAVHVEDHPVSYIDFEGSIPEGQYGGGTVMVWDRGTFEPTTETPEKDLAGGKLHFVLKGEKLNGEWYLVRLRDDKEWLLIKGGADMKQVSAKLDDASVVSGKSMDQLSEGGGGVGQSKPLGKSSVKGRRRETAAAGSVLARAPTNRKMAGRSGKEGGDTPLKASASQVKAVGRHARRREGRSTRKTSPTPAFIEPMKARLVEDAPSGDWMYEIKFDGFRAVAFRDANGTRLLSRNNQDFAKKFPELVDAVAGLRVADAIIDGEIVALDDKGRSSFQLLQAHDLGQKRPPIIFYAFDLLQLNGRNLQSLPLVARKAELEKLLKKERGTLRYSGSLGNEADPLLQQAREIGLEGLIGKRPNSPYEPGRRSGNWIKLKLHHEQEFVIGGYTRPGGTRLHFGALLVGVYEGDDFKFAGKVGTGFDTKLLRSLHAQFQAIGTKTCPFVDLPGKRPGRYGQGMTAGEMKHCHWLKPELVCQLKFTEWTRDDRLRHPVFLGLREDKPAREVVREDKDQT
ncbi:MAG: non-homologous end-joining DNA ligase [Opitutus sp.]